MAEGGVALRDEVGAAQSYPDEGPDFDLAERIRRERGIKATPAPTQQAWDEKPRFRERVALGGARGARDRIKCRYAKGPRGVWPRRRAPMSTFTSQSGSVVFDLENRDDDAMDRDWGPECRAESRNILVNV